MHWRHCILYEPQKGSNVFVAYKNLFETLKNEDVNFRTWQGGLEISRPKKISYLGSDSRSIITFDGC